MRGKNTVANVKISSVELLIPFFLFVFFPNVADAITVLKAYKILDCLRLAIEL